MNSIGAGIGLATPLLNVRAQANFGRVAHAVRTEKITEDDAAALRAEAESILVAKTEFASDGIIDVNERYELHAMMSELGKELNEMLRPGSIDVEA